MTNTLLALNLVATSSLIVGGIIVGFKAKKKLAEMETKMNHAEQKAHKTFGRVKFALAALDED